jgi:hypothetical protein
MWLRLAFSTTTGGGVLVSPLYSYDKQNWTQAVNSTLPTAPMTTPLSGVAVTSHDPSQLARGLFADPTVK